MRTPAADFSTTGTRRAAEHLGKLVREARRARGMPQAELAERAKTSKLTVIRIEKGAVETALGTWLSVMEQVGLLHHVMAIRDQASTQLAEQQRPKRVRRPAATPDLDF